MGFVFAQDAQPSKMSVFSFLMKFVKHDSKVKLKSVAGKLVHTFVCKREVQLGEKKIQGFKENVT